MTWLLHGIKFTVCIVVCTICMTAKRIVAEYDGGPITQVFISFLMIQVIFQMNEHEIFLFLTT